MNKNDDAKIDKREIEDTTKDTNSISTNINVKANDVAYCDYDKLIDKIKRKITKIPGVEDIYLNPIETDSLSSEILHVDNVCNPFTKKKIELVEKLVNHALNGARDVRDDDIKQHNKSHSELCDFINKKAKDEDEACKYRLKTGSIKRQNLGDVDDVFIDRYGSLRFKIYGGLNGGGVSRNRWGEYFSSLRDFLTILNSNPEVDRVWLISITNDCADDVFYAEFGIDLKDGGGKDE